MTVIRVNPESARGDGTHARRAVAATHASLVALAGDAESATAERDPAQPEITTDVRSQTDTVTAADI